MQFKVQLRGIKPPIWRRIQTPDTYSFWDLHCAIQDAMGWLDSHLHLFEIANPRTGIVDAIGVPDPDTWRPLKAGWNQRISKYFVADRQKGRYLYDFGDGWEHTVTREKMLTKERGQAYPICTAGKRACPPEDCGGVYGYDDIINGRSEFQEEYSDFDPEAFMPRDVLFEDPDERRRFMMEWR